MTKLNSIGPKEWSDSFYVSVLSRKDNNHHEARDHKMVDGWTANLEPVSKVVSSHFKFAIGVASAT